ncbi:MAG: hypothetical protein KAI83_06420 [Thiomargarita sp.]|nr:hypothetical protein [Thiomargarita sp.]
MSLTADELENHVEIIFSSKRIKNKAVILCEGDISSVKKVGLNPTMYRNLERKPDADLYKACLPREMRKNNAPQFFNCGGRSDVIKVFCQLKALHTTNLKNSYLDINKLFAIIDLDIQKANIDNYSFQDTDEIFYHLYNELKINPNNIDSHLIFTTGLIHKEAYFLLPLLTDIFDNHKNPLLYVNDEFSLEKIYTDIIEDIDKDKDLSTNFDRVCNRINFSGLNCSTVSELKNAFLNQFHHDIEDRLIQTLFLIRKIKPYWEKINTHENISSEKLREQLALEIAKFYADKDDDNFHITAILKSIYQRALGGR